MAPRLRPALLALALLLAPGPPPARSEEPAPLPAPNALSPDEEAAGFRLLFDGRSLAGWRGYRKEAAPDDWEVVEGALTRVGGGSDLVTREAFANFELRLEWKVEPGGNSGILYRVSEEERASYWSGPEMQVLDDAGHRDGRSRLTAAGACYGLYASPAGVVLPAEQWNQVRLLVDGPHVEHWLNGTKVAAYELGSADWEARVKDSKFASHEHFGRNRAGLVALQNHGDRVAYRSIRIRVLP